MRSVHCALRLGRHRQSIKKMESKNRTTLSIVDPLMSTLWSASIKKKWLRVYERREREGRENALFALCRWINERNNSNNKKTSIGRIGKSIANRRLVQSFVIGSSSLHPVLTDLRVAAESSVQSSTSVSGQRVLWQHDRSCVNRIEDQDLYFFKENKKGKGTKTTKRIGRNEKNWSKYQLKS